MQSLTKNRSLRKVEERVGFSHMTAKRILKKVGCRASHKYKTQKLLEQHNIIQCRLHKYGPQYTAGRSWYKFSTSASLLVIKQASKQTFGLMKMSRESSKPKQMRLKQQVWHILREKLFLCEEKLMPTKISVER